VPFVPVALPFTSLVISDQLLQYGIWVYLVVFIVIQLASTTVGGPIPDNIFLLLTGAVAMDNRLSVIWLLTAATAGGFAGYESNYWSGRLFGLTICRGSCPVILQDKNVRRALALMNRFGPASMILSRFMPVFNIPSFVAGINGMEYPRYFLYNLFSSGVWVGVLFGLGYYIGSIPVISEYLDYITDLFIVVLAATIIVILVLFIRDYGKRKDTNRRENK